MTHRPEDYTLIGSLAYILGCSAGFAVWLVWNLLGLAPWIMHCAEMGGL